MMELKDKLRELRIRQGLTQDEVADCLHISSQSVSKWERGLLSPDIHLLPRIAVLYKTSMDALFDMESQWGEAHREEFEKRRRMLIASGDIDGAYNACMTEIELEPEHFPYYIDSMTLVLRHRLFDEKRIGRLIALTDYADGHCHDDDLRNEMHRLMLQICSYSDNTGHRARVAQYYSRLSSLKHSREVYAKYVMSGAAYDDQLRQNIMYMTDLRKY